MVVRDTRERLYHKFTYAICKVSSCLFEQSNISSIIEYFDFLNFSEQYSKSLKSAFGNLTFTIKSFSVKWVTCKCN